MDPRDSTTGQWAVLDADGKILGEHRWPTQDDAINYGLCGRYLLSGASVKQVTTDWVAIGSAGFTDKRTQLRKDGPARTLHVRAFRGMIRRRKDGKEQTVGCPHAHTKPGSARKCAADAAKRLNKAGGEIDG